jgi:hypothetical protein
MKLSHFCDLLVPALQNVLKRMKNKPAVSVAVKLQEHAVWEHLAGFLIPE